MWGNAQSMVAEPPTEVTLLLNWHNSPYITNGYEDEEFPTDSHTTLTYQTNGEVTLNKTYVNSSYGITVENTTIGNWASPTTTNIGSEYNILFTQLSQSTGGTITTPTIGSQLSLSTPRSFSVRDDLEGTYWVEWNAGIYRASDGWFMTSGQDWRIELRLVF